MRGTDAFRQYEQSSGTALKEADVADAMLAPEDTPIKTLLRNAAQFRAAAVIYEDEVALAFLDRVDEVLETTRAQSRAGYAGGMMQRKREGK